VAIKEEKPAMTLLKQISLAIQKIRMQIENIQTENGKKILEFCLKNEGKSFGNKFVELGCVDELLAIYNKFAKDKILNVYSTIILGKLLENSKKFFLITNKTNLLGGEIVISITGTGNGIIKNGHVGFYVGDNRIASNDSGDGKLKRNYTLKSWEERYNIIGGMKVLYYRVLD